MEPFGEATFQYVAGKIFRTEAKIYWGTAQKNLGLLIMLNPGSASLSDDCKWRQIESGNKSILTGRINLQISPRSYLC